jgi:hypothetical protein
LLLGLSVVCLGVACRQQPPPDDDFTLESPGDQSPGVSGQVDPALVIEHFKAQQLPIGRSDVYNAENDPFKRLGRPGQYVGKALFQDSRMPLEKLPDMDVIAFQSSGGIIEIFNNTSDLQDRKEALELARKQFPTAAPEYQYTNGVILLRLGHIFTPDQAEQYEQALASFQG